MNIQIPDLSAAAFVADNASVYGDVTAAKNSSIWFHSTVRGDTGAIYIGEGSNVQDNCVLHTDLGYTVKIGRHVTIGHNAIVHGCMIGDNTLIGMGAIILNGARIGNNCIIGAGALVTQGKVIPDNSLVMGTPGKIVRKVTGDEIIANIKNADKYVEHGKEYAEALAVKEGLKVQAAGPTADAGKAQNAESIVKSGRDPEPVIHMNMCMVKNGDEVLALDKTGSSYFGTTFPGGHVEPGESMHDAVVREVFEETGLVIKNPVLKGLYHWYKDGIHNMGYLYLATEFEGILESSEEGEVYWIPLEDFKKKPLANGMESVLRLIEDDSLSECFMEITEGGRERERLF